MFISADVTGCGVEGKVWGKPPGAGKFLRREHARLYKAFSIPSPSITSRDPFVNANCTLIGRTHGAPLVSGDGEGDFNAILLRIRHPGASPGLCIKIPSETGLLPFPALAGAGMFFSLGLRILRWFLFGLEITGYFCIWGSGFFWFGVGDLWGSLRVWPR